MVESYGVYSCTSFVMKFLMHNVINVTCNILDKGNIIFGLTKYENTMSSKSHDKKSSTFSILL